MAIKNINTDLQIEAKLLDGGGSPGTNNQILISTGTGVDWVSNNSGSWDGVFTGSAQITGSLGVTGSVLVDGNIGIGTTSPNANLHILNTGNGEIEVERASGALINIQAQSAKGLIGTDSNHTFSLKTNSSERLTILNSGRVGIGTTLPSRKLDVEHDGWDGVEIRTTSANGSGINLINSQRNFALYSRSNAFHIRDITDSDTPRFVIGSTGNVGIGTDSPNAKLDVESGATSDIVRFKNDNGSIVFGYASTQASIDLPASNTFRIRQGSETPLRIISNGNVGIGTTSPSAKLDVRTADGNSTSLRLGRIDNSSFWDFNHAGNDLRIYNSNGAGSNILLGVDPSGTVYDNKVGIGTSSPTEKLDVIGNIKASGSIQVGVNEGNPTAALVGSIRYKSDANNSFVDMVMQTDVTTYEWVNIVTNTW